MRWEQMRDLKMYEENPEVWHHGGHGILSQVERGSHINKTFCNSTTQTLNA